jgi:hypothetical protein
MTRFTETLRTRTFFDGEQMTKVTVYDYETVDRKTGKSAKAPRMATVEAIRRIKGSAVLESRCIVDAAAVDDDGFAREDVTPDMAESPDATHSAAAPPPGATAGKV